MNAIKLQKSGFTPNLSGAALLAFGVLGSNLTRAIANNLGKSTWELAQETIGASIQGLDMERSVAAIDKFQGDAVAALGSAAVKAAIESAGYGDVAQITTDAEGKQTSLGKDAKHITRIFGLKFRLRPQIERSAQTIKHYCGSIRLAVELDTEWKGKTVGQVIRANRDAIEAKDPAKVAERQLQEAAAQNGKMYASAYLAGDEQFRDLIHAFNAITDGWRLGTDELRAEALAKVGEIGLEFQLLKEEADRVEAAANAETLPDASADSSDESIHADAGVSDSVAAAA